MEDDIPQKKSVKDADRRLIWKLATMMCTHDEIADAIGVSRQTLSRKYSDLIDKGRNVGRQSLRRAQFEKAIADQDPRMLIFLGKQYLNQKDNPEDKDTKAPLPWIDD